MKTNKFWGILLMLILVCGSAVSFSSCGDDDSISQSVSSASILGLWEEDGSTSDSFLRWEFNKDGTGVQSDEDGTMNFEYTYSFDSSTATGTLKLWYRGSSTVLNYQITITGKTLMATRSGKTYIFKKK